MNPTRQDLRTDPPRHGDGLHDAVDLLRRAMALVLAHTDQWDALGAASVAAVEAALEMVAANAGTATGNGAAPAPAGPRGRRTEDIQRAVDSARAAVVASTFALREAADEERRRRQTPPPRAGA
ncbi:hypothetical protein LX15_004981 [Streptoalloteichus tenebrarius]|uniref:Putative retrotransposon protein n=1 Tax=Streptoalloteichus tenebrarius (strain ATCC 17920 / DSM 40477 / JCM 4838 / CBS 697.72 / NBRC 16177 / NCIMB 11028 / NRRL B-12390 / A12253. 1 / ISP 5477) TaxID=1933 RepID=Q2MF11_STRSD|nr:hypothetical protein [Streptoalloteichus tenebrarius]MCP2261260.1 hypothetical protein [Streptoalloteichus tenebrarius]CAH18561.1 putative retrotransposon protein [Streptoalloteichus tenebrarius]